MKKKGLVNMSNERLMEIIKNAKVFTVDGDDFYEGMIMLDNPKNDTIMFRHSSYDHDFIETIERKVLVNKMPCFMVVPFKIEELDNDAYVDFSKLDDNIKNAFRNKMKKCLNKNIKK